MTQNCSFCMEPSIAYCMSRSLNYKYNEFEGKNSGAIVDCILNQEYVSYKRYTEALVQSGKYQFMFQFTNKLTFKQQFEHSIQYYKFRVYVPLFTKSKQTDTIQNYYYSKLKHYYNTIKRKLHMEVDHSESSVSLKSYMEKSVDKSSKMLKDIRIEPESKQIPSIANFKSESKALQELVSYMKLNSHFQQIQTLKTQDGFSQQHLFEQNLRLSKDRRLSQFGSFKTGNIKMRLFNKYNDTPNKRVQLLNSKRERLPSKAESIKENNKDVGTKAKTNMDMQSPYSVKQTLRIKSMNKRYSSLGNLNKHARLPVQNEQKMKKSESTKVFNQLRYHPKHQLIIKHEEIPQPKKAIIKIQTIKFQNYPIESKKPQQKKLTLKIQRQTVNDNDNIHSIRKKKLQILKEKWSKTQRK